MSLNSFGNKLRTGPLGAIFFGIVVVCVGVLAFTGLGSSLTNSQHGQSSSKAPSDIVATVGTTPITDSEFASAVEQFKEQAASNGSVPPLSEAYQIRAAAFNQLLNPILAAQLAKDHGLTVSADDIAAERNKELGPIRQQLSLPPSASESDINTALEPYDKTVDDLVSTDAVTTHLLAEKYSDFVTDSNAATDETVRKFYTSVHVRHILISNKIHPDAQAQALAQSLIGQLQKPGANFATLAKEFSDDPGTKNRGGDDGFINSSTPYVPEFKAAALALAPGQITSTPVLSPQYGYFIIQALAVKSSLPSDYQKNHAQYAAQVTQQLVQQQEQSDLAAEKAKTKISINDPRLRADVALSDPQQGTPLPSIIADYNTALNSASNDSDKAEIYASEALVYQQLGQPAKEIGVLVSALADQEDAQLRLNLGDLYKASGDIHDALTQYQLASTDSYDNPDIHAQLIQDYQALKQPTLVASESLWLKQYQARQKQANALSSPGQTPLP